MDCVLGVFVHPVGLLKEGDETFNLENYQAYRYASLERGQRKDVVGVNVRSAFKLLKEGRNVI